MVSECPHIIVFMTDFGLNDTYVGQMKGVILSISPLAQIIDLTHSISPQNVVQGAFILQKSVLYFPAKSIIVSIVDPGVGSLRKAIAVETDRHTFLAPDNGVLTGIFQTQIIKRCISITEKRYMLAVQSATFHGRDVFSPIAGHLLAGVSIQDLGNEMDPSDCIKIQLPKCSTSDNGQTWNGSIIYTDHFGNLVTSLDTERFDASNHWQLQVGICKPIPVVTTYADVGNLQPLAYTGSSGMIEIAIRNGNASSTLDVGEGDPVRISIIAK